MKFEKNLLKTTVFIFVAFFHKKNLGYAKVFAFVNI